MCLSDANGNPASHAHFTHLNSLCLVTWTLRRGTQRLKAVMIPWALQALTSGTKIPSPRSMYPRAGRALLPLKRTPGPEAHPLDLGGAKSTMNGSGESVLHPGRGSGSVLLDLPGETPGAQNHGQGHSPVAGSWEQVPAEELIWRESGGKEAEALGWSSGPIPEAAGSGGRTAHACCHLQPLPPTLRPHPGLLRSPLVTSTSSWAVVPDSVVGGQ